jgi:hypothetical protein
MLFKLNFKNIVDMKLGAARRLPKWQNFLYAQTKPFDKWFALFLTDRHTNLRRSICDGSVIALTKLIKVEFGIDIEFADSDENNEVFVGMKNETDVQRMTVGTKNETATLLGTMKDILNVDYIVKVPVGTDAETIARISSIIGMYNSAGYNYRVETK